MTSLQRLLNELRNFFQSDVTSRLVSIENLGNKMLDEKVLEVTQAANSKSFSEITLYFSSPKDPKYKAEKGRAAYDLLCSGQIECRPFQVFINNKLGDLQSSTRNDITTYNNLLRLYLDIHVSRLSPDEITLNKQTLLKRIRGEELVSYAVFVMDKDFKESSFFALEEVIPSEFYVNPRNTMFQLKYRPKLSSTPLSYYDFCQELINHTIAALQKSITKTQSEVLALQALKHTLLEIQCMSV